LASNPEDFQLRVSGVASGDQQWQSHDKLREKNRSEWDKIGGLEIDNNITKEIEVSDDKS